MSQRKLIVPLWQYIDGLKDINPDQPIVPHVIKAMNTLELIALCVEAEAVNQQMIKRTFRGGYIDLFEKITKCKPPENVNLTSDQLVKQNPAAKTFYETLLKEEQERDKIDAG